MDSSRKQIELEPYFISYLDTPLLLMAVLDALSPCDKYGQTKLEHRLSLQVIRLV